MTTNFRLRTGSLASDKRSVSKLALGLFGVLWAILSPLHVEAIPKIGDYELKSAEVNGTFHSDGSMLTDWSFTGRAPIIAGSPELGFTSIGFTPLAGSVVSSNDATDFSQGQFNPTDPSPDATLQIQWDIDPESSSALVQYVPLNRSPEDFLPATINAVPEPATFMLLATGLIGLAGYRWSQRRQERTQVT